MMNVLFGVSKQPVIPAQGEKPSMAAYFGAKLPEAEADAVSIRFGQKADKTGKQPKNQAETTNSTETKPNATTPTLSPEEIQALQQDPEAGKLLDDFEIEIRQGMMDVAKGLAADRALIATVTSQTDASPEKVTEAVKALSQAFSDYLVKAQEDIVAELENKNQAILQGKAADSQISKAELVELTMAEMIFNTKLAILRQVYGERNMLLSIAIQQAEQATEEPAESSLADELGLSEEDLEAIVADPAFGKEMEQFAVEIEAEFEALLMELARDPDIQKAVEATQKIPEQGFERIGAFAKAVFKDIDKAYTQAKDDLLAGREVAELSQEEKLALARIKLLAGNQGEQVKGLLKGTYPKFSEIYSNELNGGQIAVDVEAIEAETLDDPAVQAELLAFRRELKERFSEAARRINQDPQWLNHHLGIEPLDEDALAAKAAHLDTKIGRFMEKSVARVNELLADDLEELFGQPVDISQPLPVGKLSPEDQAAFVRARAIFNARLKYVSKEFGAAEEFGAALNEILQEKQGCSRAELNERLNALKTGDPHLDALIERSMGNQPEVREQAFIQLVSNLASSKRQEHLPLLEEAIRLAGRINNGDIKIQGAEAILTIPDDGKRVAHMLEWLKADNINNKRAILKLFTFSQGRNNGSISAEAFRLLDENPALREAIDGVRALKDAQLDIWLGPVDTHLALRAERARKTAENQPGRNRVFGPPQRD